MPSFFSFRFFFHLLFSTDLAVPKLFSFSFLPTFCSVLQEEEKRKREELELIMAENNRKIEEAQKKLVRIRADAMRKR